MSPLLFHPNLRDCRRLFLHRHEVTMSIGAHAYEKQRPQRVMISVDLFVPLSGSTPRQDDLSEVVDYDFIRHAIRERVASGHVHLQETLCDDLLRLLLSNPHVRAAMVRTEKPDVYDDSESIGVEVAGFNAR